MRSTMPYGLRRSRAAGSGGASYRPTLQFGRRDLEKGRARATRVLLAIGVDPRFDYLPDICLEDLALLRRVISVLRKAKTRSIAAGDRDLPRCHRNQSVDDSAGARAGTSRRGPSVPRAVLFERHDRRTADRDRRSSPRVRTLKGAQIIWPNGFPIRCTVRNISETGAKLEVHEPILQNTFDLVFDLDQSRHSCRVVWRKEPFMGVKFQ
jgi:hypothetical protein